MVTLGKAVDNLILQCIGLISAVCGVLCEKLDYIITGRSAHLGSLGYAAICLFIAAGLITLFVVIHLITGKGET